MLIYIHSICVIFKKRSVSVGITKKYLFFEKCINKSKSVIYLHHNSNAN